MKLFGYFDDLLVWFFNWQVSMGWANVLIIPIELFLFYIIYQRFSYIRLPWM